MVPILSFPVNYDLPPKKESKYNFRNKVMQGIKTTKENLLTAIDDENHEFTEMYPKFISKAKADYEKKAADSFDVANKVE